MNGYLVVGAERSGTKMITRLLVRAGCVGSYQHVQDFDENSLPDPVKPIVLRKSIPHGCDYPKVIDVVYKMKGRGYSVKVIVISRDWRGITGSRLRIGMSKTIGEALSMIQKAYRHIFNTMGDVDFIISNYESITSDFQSVNALLRNIGLNTLPVGRIDELGLVNQNFKYK